MMIRSAMATSEGRWIAIDDAELLESLGDPEPDFDPAAFAVRNLGFVRYDEIGDSFVQVELFPKHACPAALGAVEHRIRRHPGAMFRIRYLDAQTKRWERTLVPTPMEAIGRLVELCSIHDKTEAQHGGYRVTPHDLDTVLRREDHPGNLLVRKWRSSFNRFDDSVIPFLTSHGIARSMMVIGIKPNSADPRFRYIGESFWPYGDDFFLRSIGEKVSSQPDKDYGEWVSRFYVETAQTWKPRYEECEAVINNTVRGPSYRYERLMLPWSTETGEVFITLASRFLDSPDDRSGGRGASSDSSTAKSA